MARTSAFVLLALLFAIVDARPSFEPYFGIKELRSSKIVSVRADGKQDHSQSHRFVDPASKKFIEINYDARVVTGIIALDDEHTVEAVQCLEEGLNIVFNTTADVNAFLQKYNRETGLISGGAEWGCDGVILRKQIKKAFAQGLQIIISTKDATHADFFEKANFKFNSDLFQYKTTEPVESIKQDSAYFNQKSERDVGSFFSGVWNEASSLGDDVQGLVNDATNIVGTAVSGDFDLSHVFNLPTFGINYANGGAAQQLDVYQNQYVHIGCTNCYSKFSTNVKIAFQIDDFSFGGFEADVTGDSYTIITAAANANAQYNFNNNLNLGTINVPSIPFTVAGVPFVLTIQIPSNVGVSGSFGAQAQFGGHVFAEGSYTFGVTATPNGVTTRRDHTFTCGGKMDTITPSATFDLEVYFVPTIIVNIDKIGGPNLGLKLFLESSGNANLGSSGCANHGGAVSGSASLAWGAQVTIGAMISVEIAGHEIYGPKQITARTLYSTKLPIVSGCVSFGGNKRDSNDSSSNSTDFSGSYSIDSTTAVPGMTWSGVNDITCDNDTCQNYCGQQGIMISYQYVGNATIGDELTNIFVGSYSGVFGDDGSCVIQLAYAMNVTNGNVAFYPLEDNNGFAIGYAVCESTNSTLVAQAAYGTISDDLSQMKFVNPDGCSVANLFNSMGDDDDSDDII